jgi:hypothetical protein
MQQCLLRTLLAVCSWTVDYSRDTCVCLRLFVCASGGIGSSDPPANPCSWLSDKLWGELVRLSSDVPGFDGLEASFREDPGRFKVHYCFFLTQ